MVENSEKTLRLKTIGLNSISHSMSEDEFAREIDYSGINSWPYSSVIRGISNFSYDLLGKQKCSFLKTNRVAETIPFHIIIRRIVFWTVLPLSSIFINC